VPIFEYHTKTKRYDNELIQVEFAIYGQYLILSSSHYINVSLTTNISK